MSVRLMADVFEFSEARGTDRMVLLAIADEADDDGKGGYPGFDLLAHKCRLPRTTVRRAVDRLEELGELRVFRPVQRGRGHYTTYEVTIAEKRARVALSGNGPDRAETGHNGPDRADEVPLTSTTNGHAVRGTQDASKTLSAFDRFWDVYPLHVGRQDALRAWAKIPKGVDPEAVIAGAERYRDDKNRKPDFTKHPGPWLRAGRWEDDPLPPSGIATNGHAPPPHVSIPAAQRRAEEERLKAERRRLVERLAVD